MLTTSYEVSMPAKRSSTTPYEVVLVFDGRQKKRIGSAKLKTIKGQYSDLNREPTVPHTVALPIELYYP